QQASHGVGHSSSGILSQVSMAASPSTSEAWPSAKGLAVPATMPATVIVSPGFAVFRASLTDTAPAGSSALSMAAISATGSTGTVEVVFPPPPQERRVSEARATRLHWMVFMSGYGWWVGLS